MSYPNSLVQMAIDELGADAALALLAVDFHIDITVDPVDPRLVSLKYNQIESPMGHPLVQECRGLVVDRVAGRVLAHPYNKFWNLGDHLAPELDWSTARVLEKLDGSLMILYWDPTAGEWAVASSGTPRGHGSFGTDSTQTFGEAFWKTWNSLGYMLPYDRDRGCTFCFEFCAEPNRIVVKHSIPRIVLHGGRAPSGREFGPGALSHIEAFMRWEIVKSFPMQNENDALLAALALDPIAQEGYVVVDANFNRVKIKSPAYVALHHLRGSDSPRRAIELWQTGETNELLLHFPDMAEKFEKIHATLDAIAHDVVLTYNEHRGAVDRKAFALAVKDHRLASWLFRCYGREVTVEDVRREMRAGSTAPLERLIA